MEMDARYQQLFPWAMNSMPIEPNSQPVLSGRIVGIHLQISPISALITDQTKAGSMDQMIPNFSKLVSEHRMTKRRDFINRFQPRSSLASWSVKNVVVAMKLVPAPLVTTKGRFAVALIQSNVTHLAVMRREGYALAA